MEKKLKIINAEWLWREVLFVFISLFAIEFFFVLYKRYFFEIILNILNNEKNIAILFYILIIRAVDIIFIVCYTVIYKNKSWMSLGLSVKGAQKKIRYGLIASLMFAVGVLAAEVFCYFVFSKDMLKLLFGSGNNRLLLDKKYLLSYILVAAICSPFVEEVVFRGILYPALRRYQWSIFAIVINAAIFAVAHGLMGNYFVVQFAGGLIFAYIYEKNASIIPAYIVHSMGNLAILLVEYYYILT